MFILIPYFLNTCCMGMEFIFVTNNNPPPLEMQPLFSFTPFLANFENFQPSGGGDEKVTKKQTSKKKVKYFLTSTPNY